MKNKDSQDFDINFRKMLKELTSFLFAKFIESPTVNAIKDDIYISCISLNTSNKLQHRFTLNEDSLSQKIEGSASSKISKALLLLYAYLNPNQKELIPISFDIEHIFPKKWQDTNYNGWSKEDANLYLDRFGNKTVFEKKLNIQAGNGYFGVKKEKYRSSSIATVQGLANYPKNDWTKEDIEEREENFKTSLMNYFRDNLAVKQVPAHSNV